MRKCSHRPPPGADWNKWWVRGQCEYGGCEEFNCPICGCYTGMGWGLMDCPCEDWIGYHQMRSKPAVAVKPSVRGRSVASRQRSRRRHLKGGR